jgi:hypothetical protein
MASFYNLTHADLRELLLDMFTPKIPPIIAINV